MRGDLDNDDFLGHIGGDDFIAITTPERMETLASKIVKRFDALAPSFYKEEDRQRKKIISSDRRGNAIEYPLLSVAIGICHNKLRPLTSYGHVVTIGAELKQAAKRQRGSAFVIDRRRE